ncbi:hypothetical protein HDU96_009822 [Phlyctochytrium bullatum]|nr:hypothetical protein HDU96_009822 [Phlyctochytrium bullatum]
MRLLQLLFKVRRRLLGGAALAAALLVLWRYYTILRLKKRLAATGLPVVGKSRLFFGRTLELRPRGSESLEQRMYQFRMESMEEYKKLPDNEGKKGFGFFSFLIDPMVVGPRGFEITLLDLDSILELLRSANDFYLPKANVYQLVKPLIGEGVLASHGSKWRAHRAMLEIGFRQDNLRKITPGIVELTDTMLDRWEKKPEDFDCRMELLRLTLQVITSLGFGFSSETIDAGADEPLYHIYRLLNEQFASYTIGQLKDKRLFERRLAHLEQVVTSAVASARTVAAAKAPSEAPGLGILMDCLLKRDAASGDFVLSAKEMEDEIKTLMFAGHDTTGNTLAWVMYVLAHEKEVVRELEDEIEAYCPDGRKPTMQDVDRMPYLNNFVKEILRTHAPAAFGRRVTHDISLSTGLQIPAGVSLMFFPPYFFLNEKYVERASEFIPSRWDEDSPLRMDKRIYIPFSFGPRNCVGMKLALLEIKLVVVRVLQRFSVQYAEGQGEPITGLLLTLGPHHVNISVSPKVDTPTAA